MTAYLVSARYFGGNHEQAKEFLYEHKYFCNRLSASQFKRRLHSISEMFYEELIGCFWNYAKMTKNIELAALRKKNSSKMRAPEEESLIKRQKNLLCL